MSFIAAISLIGAYEKGWFDFNKMPFLNINLKEKYSTRIIKTLLRYFFGIILTSLIAGISVMPFSIYYFGYFQSYSLLSNFISTPVLGLIVMPFGLISLLLMPLGLEKYPLLLTGYGIEKINNIAHFTAYLPYSSILTSHMPPLTLILISLGILWIYLSNYKPFMIGFLIIICGIFIHFNYKSPDIIISSKGELIAVNSDKGLLPNPSRKERYARKIWLKAFGQKKPAADYKDYWIKDNKYKDLGDNIKFKCNEDYCTYKNNNYKAYILEKEEPLATICQDADIIISRINILNKCAKP
jgi:competence protein ComEC